LFDVVLDVVKILLSQKNVFTVLFIMAACVDSSNRETEAQMTYSQVATQIPLGKGNVFAFQNNKLKVPREVILTKSHGSINE